MNKYQKIALAVGAIVLVLLFGKTVTQVGLRVVASMGKFLILVVVIVIVISLLKKAAKKN